MYTTCPECGTVFRVTVAVLRTARGQVRCGVCAATFDALLYLSEQVDTEDASSEPGPDPGDTASQAALPAQYAPNAPDARDEAAARARSTTVDRDADRDEPVADDAPDSLDAHLGEFAFDDDTGIEEVEALRTRAARDAALAGGASGDRDRARADERAPGDPRTPAPAAEQAFDIDLQFDDSLSPDDVFPVEMPAQTPHTGRDAPVANASEMDTLPDDVPIEVAAEILVANADALPPPDFPPFEEPTPAPPVVRPFEQRAGRNSPSADEDRALAQIAAALARGAQCRNGPQAERQDALDVEILDPSVAENMLASGDGGLEEIPDSALEFNLPAEKWDEVFVADPETPTIPPLDAQLAHARDVALAMPPPRTTDAHVSGDLDIEIESIELSGDEDDDDRELDEADLDDGDLDDADAAALDRARAARTRSAAAEDPLATTDQFPPLRVTPEEEAAAGLAHTPAARRHDVAAAVHAATHEGERPRPGATAAPVPTPDFDALVAAAAARAAAEVAARVTPALVAQHVGAQTSAAQASTPNALAASLAAPLTPAMAGGGGTLSADPAPMASTPGEAPDWIQFDAKRFHDVARGGAGRAWWATALLALGIVALALGLGVQVVHHYRDTLAQHPVAGPPLRELYARLGLPLEPQWNLAGYELKQWGAATDAEPGTLRVRASVVNRAPRGQPYPLLRVTLEDRFGGRLARREFTPAEYLPGRTPPAQLLAPGARVDADLLIADPGSDAVGFELDVCLPRHGRTVCGTDLARGGG